MESFKDFAKSKVQVIRNSNISIIDAPLVVVGDVVVISSGNKIPADMRIFKGTADLNVDNSSLTGESLPIRLSSNCGAKGIEDPKEAKNVAFFSTLCTSGSGSGIVFKTGGQTFIGRIADLASTAEAAVSTLKVELDQMILFLAVVAIAFGIIFFVLGFIIGIKPLTCLINAIGLIVANIPEGLLGAITLALTITSKKMMKHNVLVKNLNSIETLGSLTCICSDKTGTLTQNKMTVQHLWYDKNLCKVRENQLPIENDTDNGIEKVATDIYLNTDKSFEFLQLIAVCGSAAQFIKEVPTDFKPVNDEKIKFVQENPFKTDEEVANYINNIIRPMYQNDYEMYIQINVDEANTSNLINLIKLLIDGDASETGMLKFFQKNLTTGIIKNCNNIEDMRRIYPIHLSEKPDGKGEKVECKIPFNSTNKFVAYLLDYKEIPNNEGSPSELFVAFKVMICLIFFLTREHLIDSLENAIDIYFTVRRFQWIKILRLNLKRQMIFWP